MRHNRLALAICALGSGLCLVAVTALAESAFEKARREAREGFEEARVTANADFVEERKKATERFQQFRDGVIDLWGEFPESTDNQWWIYSQTLGTRIHADLNTGVVTTEVVVTAESPEEAIEKASQPEKTEEVAETLTEQLSPDNDLSAGLTFEEEPEEVVEAIVEDLKTDPEVREIPQEPGSDEKKFSVVTRRTAKPHPSEKRAEAFWPLVQRYSKKYKVDPALVLAVMHTESAFRPTVESHAGAVGLMQIMPRWAGLEARRLITGNHNIGQPTREMLCDPETNVHYGVLYLRELQKRYFRGVSDCHNSFFSICGYNWGPGRVQKIKKSHGLVEKDPAQVFDLLRTGEQFPVPHETQRYLMRVHQRRLQVWTPWVQERLGNTYPGAPTSCVKVTPVSL